MRFLSVNADCFLIELASLEETLALYNKLHTVDLFLYILQPLYYLVLSGSNHRFLI